MAAGNAVPAGAEAETLKECGTCHMAYPPEMLPIRSCQKIMSGLVDHFGENAALSETVRADIEAYLLANAGHGARRQTAPSEQTGMLAY